MSHFTTIRTQMVDKAYLKQGLLDLGHACQEGQVEVRGFRGARTPVEITIATGNPGYDIGFRQAGSAYEMVADWWGIRDIRQEQFVQQLTQRYAYHAARAKMEEQGFSLVSEETQQDGKIHLVLRRMA